MKRFSTLEKAKNVAMGANTYFYILKTKSGYALGIYGASHLFPDDLEYVVGEVSAYGGWRSYRHDIA